MGATKEMYLEMRRKKSYKCTTTFTKKRSGKTA
jgi:hypothetical protein